MTNNLVRRAYEHKTKKVASFKRRYNVNKLAYYETPNEVRVAIAREKEIKGWVRRKKVASINSANPAWEDLSLEWKDPPPCHSRCNGESRRGEGHHVTLPPPTDTFARLRQTQYDNKKNRGVDTLVPVF